jgi:hypothetical protein
MPPPLRFEKFGGMIPALDERLLPPENAVYSENAFLQAGRLEPLAADISLYSVQDPFTRYAFRVPIGNPGIDNLVDSYWLEFDIANTFVVRSPVNDSSDGGRYYWANGNGAPGYTTKERLAINDPIWGSAPGTKPPLVLGIPRPEVAPSVVVSGGSPPTETRAYVYTWVSASDEEGQPSPPVVATGNADGTWTVTVTAPTAPDMADRTLTYTRIYRTVVGPDGNVDFFLVTQIPIATLVFVDNVPGDVVANSPILQSTDWAPPPAGLKGMVTMPNGMVAGWIDNTVCFCEPYRPHAWPTAYQIGVEAPIVGMGAIDQNLMILTSGQPYVATGIHPSVMALRKVQPVEPCTAPQSVVSTPLGVMYTSNNGLILIGPAGGQNVTYDTIRKDEWMRLINLDSVHASWFMNGYYCYSGVVDGVFQEDAFQNDAFQQEDFLGTQVGAHISSDQRVGYMTLTCDSPTFNVMTDVWTGETLVLRSGKVFHVDRREYQPRQSYRWQSKIIQLPYPDNYGAGKVFFNIPLGGKPYDGTVLRVYADGVLRATQPVTRSGQQFRLPSGFKADFYQFELEGQLMIYNVQIAGTPRELRQV